ncbi:hypothetical protein [Phaffia rhodozyma]|uniref:FAD/NAD(P)-binding domain-containing protein n=1 Tax=Phaffia rhodozyma TaxID=264483 RepID=A0A0F7SST9_PHARH|nr:hypothetical protein [Phaffia rhodozyma]
MTLRWLEAAFSETHLTKDSLRALKQDTQIGPGQKEQEMGDGKRTESLSSERELKVLIEGTMKSSRDPSDADARYSSRKRAIKVAVVGSGLAGLTTVWLLMRKLEEERKQGRIVEVHLFEKAPSIGFFSNSLDVPLSSPKPGGKQTWAVDVPMRSFQGGYYPRLIAMYRSLGISISPTSFSYSFSHHIPLTTHFIHSGASGLSIPALPTTSSPFSFTRALLRLLGYALGYVYLLILTIWYSWTGMGGGEVGDWMRRTGKHTWGSLIGSAWEGFIKEIVFSLFGAVATCSDAEIERMDVGLIFDYIYLTLFTSHYTVPSNSSSISQALLSALPRSHIHLNTTITGLHRSFSQNSTTLVVKDSTDSGSERVLEDFTDVVFATQANQAKVLLKGFLDELTEADRETDKKGEIEMLREVEQSLGEFKYVPAIVVNHRSPIVLPAHPADIKDINLVRPSPDFHPDSYSPSSPSAGRDGKDWKSNTDVPFFDPADGKIYTMATHVVQSPVKDESPVFQTTNPIVPIPKEMVLSVSQLERALPTRESAAIVSRFRPSHPLSFQGFAGVWFTGAYAFKGIPLLEGCVASAMGIVDGKNGILDRD